MPKLHPLAQEPPLQKTSLPPQPVLSKPAIHLSTSTSAPPAMPTLHKIPTAAAPVQKATPPVGGAIPAPPLKPNPNVMPKLTTSLGQVAPAPPAGLPLLSRAPVSAQPPPQILQRQTVSSTSIPVAFQLNPSLPRPTAPKMSSVGRPPKQASSVGKVGRPRGSGTKKKKK